MDMTGRLNEAQFLTRLLREFGGLGNDAVARVAPGLLDALDDAEGSWLKATGAALAELRLLAPVASNWPNAPQAQQTQADIANLSKQHAKQVARLVDVSALAAETLARLIEITVPGRAQELAELRAAGVPESRITTLYPFSLAEHLPAITRYALHSPQSPKIAPLLRNSEILDAWNKFSETKPFMPSGVPSAAFKQSEAYIRATEGPRTADSSPYENVVSLWAYTLTFFHEIAVQQRAAVSARTKTASAMKHQVSIVHDLRRALTGQAGVS